MRDDTRQSNAAGGDWVSAVQDHVAKRGDELELAGLQTGDRLQVRTQHTLYEFWWEADGWAVLRTDRKDRPSGRVKIHGCALGAGTTIAPDRLFNGGSLEFVSGGGEWVHRTTPILWISVMRMVR